MSAYQDKFIGNDRFDRGYTIPSNTVELALYKIGVTCTEARYSAEPEYVGGHLIHNLSALVAGERQEPLEYETYASWWDHFKDRYFGKWLKSKFPVKKNKTTIGLDLLYPRLKTKLPPDLMGDRVCLFVNRTPRMVFDPSLGAEHPMEWRYEMSKKITDYRACPYCRRKIFDQ